MLPAKICCGLVLGWGKQSSWLVLHVENNKQHGSYGGKDLLLAPTLI